MMLINQKEWTPIRKIIDDCLMIVSPDFQLDSIISTFNASETTNIGSKREATTLGHDLYYIRLALNLWECMSQAIMPDYCTVEDQIIKRIQISYELLASQKGMIKTKPIYVESKLERGIKTLKKDQSYNPEVVDSHAFRLFQEFTEFLVYHKGETLPLKPREEKIWESLTDEKWPYPATKEKFSQNDRIALLRYLPKTIEK